MLKQMGCWAVVGLGLGFACPALGQEACPAIEITPLEGHDRTVVTGLNNWGQVSAFSYREGAGPSTGFIWHDGRARPLAALVASGHTLPYALNDVGQLVGEASDETAFHPVLWSAAGVSRLPGQPGDRADAINNRGEIGGSRGGSCLWWRSARREPVVIGNLGGDFCYVRGINERGEVVGVSLTASAELHGFHWYEGVLTDVSDAQLSGASSSLAAINEHGLAAGYGGASFDVLVFRRGQSARLVTAGARAGATAINDWATIFALREIDGHLLLVRPSGRSSDLGALTGGVNSHSLYGNNLYQVAWHGADLKGYFCQLRAW